MVKSAKSILKGLPGVGRRLWRVRQPLHGTVPKRSTEEIFTSIFRRRAWGGRGSVSGPGSNPAQTERLVASLRNLMEQQDVRSMLDIPCGDFHWMQRVNLQGLSYVGADIVRELVAHNQRYATNGITFRHMDLLTDALPKADLVLCRDCLVHFSFEDVFLALTNLCASGSTYLLTTTFPQRQLNLPIQTGRWRTLNLEQAPFHLPPPIELLEEGCTENGGEYADKSLALWRLSDIQGCLLEGAVRRG